MNIQKYLKSKMTSHFYGYIGEPLVGSTLKVGDIVKVTSRINNSVRGVLVKDGDEIFIMDSRVSTGNIPLSEYKLLMDGADVLESTLLYKSFDIVEKVAPKLMTKSEIEEILGYPIELV